MDEGHTRKAMENNAGKRTDRAAFRGRGGAERDRGTEMEIRTAIDERAEKTNVERKFSSQGLRNRPCQSRPAGSRFVDRSRSEGGTSLAGIAGRILM